MSTRPPLTPTTCKWKKQVDPPPAYLLEAAPKKMIGLHVFTSRQKKPDTCLKQLILDAYLGIHGRVPVRVIEDDSVSAREIHADTAAARGQDENEELGVGVVALHQNLALLGLGGPVQAQVGVAV